jgi:hypothetical protein
VWELVVVCVVCCLIREVAKLEVTHPRLHIHILEWKLSGVYGKRSLFVVG